LDNRTFISAQDAGIAVFLDPQFKLPDRPKVSRHLNWIATHEGSLVCDGSPDKQVFHGNAVRRFLPELIERADGTRTIPEILESLSSYPMKFVFDSLSLLYSRGVLYDGTGDAVLHEDPFLAWAERHLDLTRVNASVPEVRKRLDRYSIEVAGVYGNHILEELQCYPITLNRDLAHAGAKLRIYIHAAGSSMDDVLQYGTTCYEEGVPWILVTLHEDRLWFGPYFENQETLCVRCLSYQLEELGLPREPLPVDQHLLRAATSYVAVEVINFLTMLAPSSLIHGVKRLHLISLDQDLQTAVRYPYCPLCDPHPGETHSNTVSRFEEYIAFPSRHLLNQKDHQSHYKTANLQLTKLANRYPSSPSIGLPEVDLDGEAAESTDRLSDIEKLAFLLNLAAGFQRTVDANPRSKSYRWAPTGGNLGSVGLYFVNLGVSDLPEGIYYYQAIDHCLAQLHQAVPESFRQMLSEADRGRMADGLMGYLIFTGSLSRVRKKYREFGYKIVHLDAGVAYTQASFIAEYLHMNIDILDSWDLTVIGEQLYIDISEELPTLAVSLGRR